MLLFQGNVELVLATSSCADTASADVWSKACSLVFSTDLEVKVSVMLSAERKCVRQGGAAL